jgi:hypothetical protein
VVLVGVFLCFGLRADDPGLPLLLFLMVVGEADDSPGLPLLGLFLVVGRSGPRSVPAVSPQCRPPGAAASGDTPASART